MRLYSVVIPVYNRPEEVRELLTSLLDQTFKNFEVLIIEDGSTNKCDQVVEEFNHQLNIRYYFKENSGQGFTRNYGFKKAKGDYLIVFDSDCLIPNHYFQTVDDFLEVNSIDAFGGPDSAHPSFNTLQKAISYSMTSPFTTGGIRGNKKHVGKFHPRSFNMGISRKVFEETGGYRLTRMGEDIEFSIRVINAGFKTGLIESAYVYHKRRTSISQFYKQLHFFGRARVNVNRFFPGEMKLIHLLPAVFTLGFIGWLSTYLWSDLLFKIGGLTISFFFLAILIHSSLKTKNIAVGFASICTAFVQLFAYGMGLITEKISPRGNQPFAQK
ncbi:glycosyltransferase [Roseivirga misakiensis]|uniref:Glycosyltransferase n=1 Tax=Roseivirga misakiensis TaxID=1563681 RepID=A0A1E5SK19_9BACT|nr:glycosyltransferase [Roseivirga misakiensis]OEJ99451.1 glycosyltransferase [Roseivirga misakiensis]